MTTAAHPNTDCSNCGHTSDSGLSDAEARDLGWPYA